MGRRSQRSLAVLAAWLLPSAAVPGQVARRILDARDVISQVGTDAPLTLEIPSPWGLRTADRPALGAEPTGSAEDRLMALIRSFTGDELELQGTARGLLIVGGPQEASNIATAVVAAVRTGAETNVGLTGFLRRGDGPWQRTRSVEPDAGRRFQIAVGAETLKAIGTFDECVASGLVANAPEGRQVLWHGVRVTVRPTATSAESFWAHGSALLASQEDSRFEWGGPSGGTWSVRAEHSPPRTTGAKDMRLLALGPLLRRPLSPLEPRLGGGVPARDEDVALTQQSLLDALLAKAGVADSLGKVKLCRWREFVLVSGGEADVAAVERALALAAAEPQARIEVAHGAIAPAALGAADADGSLGPEAAATLVHSRVPTVVGQPFGLAFVSESAGQPPRGLEVEGLALARPDGGLTLVARVAATALPAPAAAASRPANQKRIVQLRADRWAVLEHARLPDGQEQVVLVRAHREPERKRPR